MKTDTDLERLLRDALRQELDGEYGPDPVWDESPAAHRVAEQERRRPRGRTLRLLAVAAIITIGGGAAVILGSPDEQPRPPAAANGWIAQSSGGDIYFLALDQDVRRVVGTDADGIQQGCPAFSPDGRRLAYGRVAGEAAWSGQGASFGTYRDSTLVIADVADDGRVTDDVTIDIGDGRPPPCPVWSPTGDRIAYAVPLTSTVNPTRGAEGSEVRILTLADRSVTVLPDLLATDLEFSPDGSLLGIASGTDEPGEALNDGRIHVYELASGAVRTLEGTLGAMTFTWSPDGGRIAYQTGDSQHELRLIDLATEEQRELSSSFRAVHGIGPVWSPDGESIVYQRLTNCCEEHEVVLVWPDDLSPDGTPREEAFMLFDRTADGSERELYPYEVTWSPDGEYLLFSAWPEGGRSLVGVAPSAPGSPSEVLVSGDYPGEDSEDAVYAFFEPFIPIQTWGRLPADAASSTPGHVAFTAEPNSSPWVRPSAEVSPSPSTWVGTPARTHLLVEGTDSGVPITVTITAPLWNGEPNRGNLCWGDPGDTSDICFGPPNGAGLVAYVAREYYVYEEACEWATTRPDAPATTVDELIDALARQGSRNESGPEDIVVDGYAGKRISLPMHLVTVAPCDVNGIAMFGLPENDPAWYTQSHDQIEEVWAVDVDGVLVVLVGAYYPETPRNAVDELRAILASATFE